jgi:molybdopterin molybdotransferase
MFSRAARETSASPGLASDKKPLSAACVVSSWSMFPFLASTETDSMLSVAEALEQILAQATPREPVVRPAASALGLVLAENVTSDVDSPPHDKSIVDGYAVIASDLVDGGAELIVIEEVAAGALPSRALTPGTATHIMTGAPVPEGADAVVMVEKSRRVAHDRIDLRDERITAGQNIARRASSMSRGQTVLARGKLLRSIELGVLAETGHVEVRVVPRPSVAVLSTGNELVETSRQPAAGQIRNSNGPLLAAAARAAGAEAHELGIARDERESLRAAIARGLERDILVISGGVSAGVFDLVPGVLAELGVRQVFHKIDLKPGKPLWFGATADIPATLVFGLPGNPVSSFVCFELFVRPAIGRLALRDEIELPRVQAALVSNFVHRSARPTYHPARLSRQFDHWTVEPLPWKGSGDLRTLVDANALAIFPSGERPYEAGEKIAAVRLDP